MEMEEGNGAEAPGSPEDEEEKAKKLERKKKEFRWRMQRFDRYSQISGLSVDEIEWPLIEGIPLQKTIFVGSTFDNDLNRTKPDSFTNRHFLDLTAVQLYAAGEASPVDESITKFVFSKVTRSLVNYCNYMYTHAVRDQRSMIETNHLWELLGIREYRFYLFCRHFYPRVHPRGTGFENQFTARIHSLYHESQAVADLYHSTQWYNHLIDAGEPIFKNHIIHANDGSVTDDSILRITYVIPNGNRPSSFYARRFHEAIGCPPLQVDIILVLAWLAKLMITEMVIETSNLRRNLRITRHPTLDDYRTACDPIADLLFELLPIVTPSISRPLTPPPERWDRRKPTKGEAYYEHTNYLEKTRREFYEHHFSDRLFYLRHSGEGVKCARRI